MITTLQQYLDKQGHDPGSLLRIRPSTGEPLSGEGDWEVWAGYDGGPLNATIYFYCFTQIDGKWVIIDEGGLIS